MPALRDQTDVGPGRAASFAGLKKHQAKHDKGSDGSWTPSSNESWTSSDDDTDAAKKKKKHAPLAIQRTDSNDALDVAAVVASAANSNNNPQQPQQQ